MAKPTEFQQALESLARRIGLSPAESLILEFTLQLHQEQLLDDTADYLGAMTSAKVYRALAAVLDLTEDDARFALGPLSVLTKTGLVNLKPMASIRYAINSSHFLRPFMSVCLRVKQIQPGYWGDGFPL